MKSLDFRLVLLDKEKDSETLQYWKESCWGEQVRKIEKKISVKTRACCQCDPKKGFRMTRSISIDKYK